MTQVTSPGILSFVVAAVRTQSSCRSCWNVSTDVNKAKYFMTVWDWRASRRLGGSSEK